MPDSPVRSALDLRVLVQTTAASADSARLPQDEVLFLFDSTAPGLFRYVRSLGLDGEASRDVVQEVFLALFHHVRLDRPRDNLKGWLFTVAHNLACKQRAKARRRLGDFVCPDVLAEIVIDPALNPEERLVETRRQKRLLAVLKALPERDRQCLALRSEGLRYREIAEVLGISLGSISKSLTRSLARLADV